MPIYQIDVQKNLGTEYWTNVYHVTMTSFDDAVDAVPLIVNGERGIHYTNITFDKARVSVYPVTGGVFTILPLAFAGELSGVADLALFNVARVEFQVPIGRPGIKMYRGALNEGDIEGVGKITSATQTRFEAWVTAVLGDVPELCKTNGQQFTDGKINVNVGMRQLRRGTRRRTEPVI